MSFSASQQFCVRWNSHLGSLGAAFPQLLADQRFVDVTLACEGHQLHCHRLVLAACSVYFESILGQYPGKHPIIILPSDIKLWEIQALVDFMYKGEVNVSQSGLADLLKCAEILQIRGLYGSEVAFNLNNLANQQSSSAVSHETNSTGTGNARIASSSTTSSCVVSSSIQRARSTSPSSPVSAAAASSALLTLSASGAKNTISTTAQSTTNFNNLVLDTDSNCNDEKSDHIKNKVNVKNIPTTSSQKIVQIDDDENESYDENTASTYENGSNAFGSISKITSTPNRLSEAEPNGQFEEMEFDENATKLSPDAEQKYSMYLEAQAKEHEEKRHQHQTQTEQQIEAQHEQRDHQDNFNNNNVEIIDEDDDVCEKKYFECEIQDDSNDRLVISSDQNDDTANTSGEPSTKVMNRLLNENDSNNLYGKIRIKSKENLFENYINANDVEVSAKKVILGTSKDSNNYTLVSANPRSKPKVKTTVSGNSVSSAELPRYLKFDKNSMTILVNPGQPKTVDIKREKDDNVCETRHNKNAAKTYSRKQSSAAESSASYYPNCIASITSNNNIFDSRSQTSKEDGEILIQEDLQSEMNADYQVNEDHSYENVICSPSVMQITYNKDDEYILGDDYDDIQIDESVYDSTDALPTLIPYERHNYMDTGNDTKLLQMPSTSSNLGSFIIAKHQSTKNSNTYNAKRRLNAKNTKNIKNYINDIKNNGNNSSNNSNDELFNPTPHAVVLRNPRSNQPRTYSTDSLYAALMDVKRGESIYRASQMHKVPRKTLRNWMKRWHIKSAYPMPSQLKQAAEKKRLKLMKESAALEALHIEKVNTRQCKTE